jgi:hypothetical protein
MAKEEPVPLFVGFSDDWRLIVPLLLVVVVLVLFLLVIIPIGGSRRQRRHCSGPRFMRLYKLLS